MDAKLVVLGKVLRYCNENKALSSVLVFIAATNVLALLSPVFEPPCVSCTLTRTFSEFGGCSNNAVPFMKAGSPRTPRSPKAQRMEDSPSRDIFGKPPVAPVNAEPTLNSSPAHAPLSGVDGDIKEAFGDRSAGRNLRDDLLMAADNVTSAMSSLVKELNSEDEDDGVNDRSYLSNGKTNDTDLDALEQQVNQIRQSLESQEERAKTGLSNGDVTMTGPSEKVISHGPSRNGKNPKGRRAGSDTDTDDDDTLKRRGDNKSSSRTQMTDDESYIQTDDDEGTLRTDDEDMEWQEAIKRWVNR